MSRLSFTGPYRRQNWTIPDSSIYYMAKNPSTSNVYQKLIQSCKYFFIKNSIIVLTCLHYTKDGWKTCAFTKKCSNKEHDMRKFDMENIESKLWILNTFDLWIDETLIPPSIISKIYKCQAKKCCFCRQSFTLKEFLFMASEATCCTLSECTVIDDKDGSPIQLETIVENLPKLRSIFITFISYATNISSKTVQKLLKLPHFSNIKKLIFFYLPESFDFDTIYEYYKSTKDMLLSLHFGGSISDAFKNRLDTIVDQILATSSLPYRTPDISYPEQDENKSIELYQRFKKENYF